jgi:hypothetical protein
MFLINDFMKQSKLILIVPHYNNPKGLEKSIASIDEKINIDIIIIDDGSHIKPNEEFIKQIYNCGHIFFEYIENNSGIGIALNRGLEIAFCKNYNYIGRLDCGDLYLKNKCSRQLEYLDNNKDIKLLGTWARVIDKNGLFLYELKHPSNFKEIKKKMYLNSVFLHPSVIFHSEILTTVGKYPIKYKRASQDYAFFFKIIKHFKAENLPEILIEYIFEPNSISTKSRTLQVYNRIRIILDNFYFGFYPLYGLLRNIILLSLSRNFTNSLKKILHNK